MYSSIKIKLAVPYLGDICYHKNGRSGSMSDVLKETVTFKILRSFIHIKAFNQRL
jgi:hypothetical protein